MTTPTPRRSTIPEGAPHVLPGRWRVDPVRSNATFMVWFAGKRVRGSLPVRGGVFVAASLADSTACITGLTDAVRTGSALLDQLLAGPGFLDAEAFPEIRFRTEALIEVPTGWRAVGSLLVKGVERPLVSELQPDRDARPETATLRLTSRWVIDSTWITALPVPALGRRVAMSCSLVLEPTHESMVEPLALGAA